MDKPKLKRDWIGRHVRITRAVETRGGDIFPAGTICEVEKYRGSEMFLRRVATIGDAHYPQWKVQRARIEAIATTLMPAGYRPINEVNPPANLDLFAVRIAARNLRASGYDVGDFLDSAAEAWEA